MTAWWWAFFWAEGIGVVGGWVILGIVARARRRHKRNPALSDARRLHWVGMALLAFGVLSAVGCWTLRLMGATP